MRKRIAIGMAVLPVTLAALPVVGAFADITDSVVATVEASCTFAREAYASGGVTNNTSHKNGADGTWSTTAGENALSTTRLNGTVTTDLGTSQFKVICNNASGYSVTVATADLSAGGSLTIPANTTYSASVSGWSPIVNGTKIANGGTIKTESVVTTGTVFEVGYGVGISSSQAAGTYTNASAAVYSLTQL